MTPRTYRAATVLLLLAFTASLADAGFWPSRWTAKPKTPDATTTPAPGTPPVAAWPPEPADIPQITLPPMPSGPSLLGPGASAGPAPRPPVPQSAQTPQPPPPPARPSLASAVELGRPTPLAEAPWNVAPMATLPAVSPQIPTNPTRPATEPIAPYAPPGVGVAVVQAEIQQVGGEQRFDSPQDTTTVRAQIEDGSLQPVRLDGPPPVPPPTNAPPLPPPPEGGYNAGVDTTRPLNKSFGDQCAEFFGFGGPACDCWFQSDHTFYGANDEGLISPVTNPFFFEDPRSLTELRPLWVYARIPYSSSLGGGQAGFLGTQARLAISPNFSVVMNKLGGIGLHPDEPNAAGVDGASGLAEVDIGPKWTFWRCPDLGMVAATGLTFQLPIGSANVYQDTGTMGLDLYASYGWNFGRTSWGNFNYLTSLGYDFGLDRERSEFFHTSQHLSFDVLNRHHVYPLVEVSWYKYTRTGDANSFNFEGQDLFNFGSENAGLHSYVSVATGARFKLNENIQTGIAAEWNVHSTPESVDKFRLTVDLIFRY